MKKVWCFLDLNNPAVAWAIMRGVFVSVGEVPGQHPNFVSFMQAGLVQHQQNFRFRKELLIEGVRSERFANEVSRLRGMYFLESRELAESVLRQNWGGHFRAENLFQLSLDANSEPTRVDANWITFSPQIDDKYDLSGETGWIDSYWDGTPFPDHEPLWELITNGSAIITDKQLREHAYENVKRMFPGAWIFIEMSRLAGEVGSNAGVVMPYVLRRSVDEWELVYLIYDQEFKESEVIARMKDHPDFERLAAEVEKNETFPTPNFKHCFCSFHMKVESISVGDSMKTLFTIHRS